MADKTYFLEVDSAGGGGLPVGVNYDLRISIERHPVADFVFGPDPLFEDEGAQNPDGDPSGPVQDINSEDNWFDFFDANVGNAEFNGGVGGFTGIFDFTTPYARIQGNGDGSFDLYGYTITQEMLNSQSVAFDVTPGGASATDTSKFFTSINLGLNGRVSAGDVWTLGLRYRDYAYVAQPGDTLVDVANGLKALLEHSENSRLSTITGDVGRARLPAAPACSFGTLDPAAYRIVIKNSTGTAIGAVVTTFDDTSGDPLGSAINDLQTKLGGAAFSAFDSTSLTTEPRSTSLPRPASRS